MNTRNLRPKWSKLNGYSRKWDIDKLALARTYAYHMWSAGFGEEVDGCRDLNSSARARDCNQQICAAAEGALKQSVGALVMRTIPFVGMAPICSRSYGAARVKCIPRGVTEGGH